MADRRSFPFRFWTSNQRRITPRPAALPPETVSTRTPSPKIEAPADSQPATVATTASFKTPPTYEPENQEQDPSTITNEPPTPLSREAQTAIQSTNDATPTNLVDEPQTSSISLSTSQSRASSQPASPSRRTSQSRSPARPLSPSRVSPKTRSPTSSPPPKVSLTPQKKSLPRSPSHSTSRSPKLASSPSIKRVQPNSQSKRSSSKSNVSSFVPNEEEPKPAASQHEPIELQQPANFKNDNVHNSSGLSTNETNITHNKIEVVPPILLDVGITTTPAQRRKPSEPSQNMDNTPNLNDEHEPISGSSVNPKETKEVKVEVLEQVKKTENMEETEKEINGFLTPKPGSESHTTKNLDTGSDSDPMHEEKQEMKQGTTPGNDKQSDQPRRENVPLHQEIREDLSTFVNKMAIGDPKSGVQDKPVSVITLAGENRGASMHLGSDSSRTEGPIHIHRCYKIDPNESPDTTTDLESHSKPANKMENPRTLEDQPAEAYVNNNAQSINNSLVFNCFISERNPGVHMVLANVPKEYIEPRDKTKVPNIQKAEFSTTTAEKVMYEPRIRRRCLQGLFLEPSDSETEDMEKPRRHGCRVGCKTRGQNDEINVQ